MRAIAISEPGGPQVLREVIRPVPVPGPSEVLVRVKAAGVNRPDVLQRKGMYRVPDDANPLPGLEIAGEIVAVGGKVRRWTIGDSIMALTHGGGYAQFACVDERHCLPVPAPSTMLEAAAIPETFFTVWYNVFMRANLVRGETILIHGGSSGIGTTAIQLAKAHGSSVIVTAGTDEKCHFCLKLGADHAINYKNSDWESLLMELTDGAGVNVVLDMVAGPYMQKNINVLGRDGRYIIIAFLQGPTAELNMLAVLGRRLTITGSTLRPQTSAEKANIAADLEKNVLPFLDSGEIKPIIHSVFPLTEASRAHALMESSEHMGKIVLEVG